VSDLNTILKDARDRWSKAGGTLSDTVIRELREHRKTQRTIFIVVEVLLVLAVVFCVYWLITHPAEKDTVKWILSSVIGLGTGGALEAVRRIWKEWSRTDLLLILLRNATEAQVNTILEKLIGQL